MEMSGLWNTGININVGLNARGVEQGFARLQRATSDFDNALSRLGRTIATVFSAVAIEEFIRRTTNAFVEFNRQISNVATMSEANIARMERAVQRLAARYGKDLIDSTRALYNIVSSGYDGAQALEVLEASMKAAKAGAAGLYESANAVIATLKAYGMTTRELNAVLDVHFATLKKGRLTYSELAHSVGFFLPQAKSLGEDLKAAMGAFAYLTQIISPDEAKVSLNAIYRNLAQNVDKFRELGIQLYDSQGRFIGLARVAEQVAEKIRGMSDAARTAFFQQLQMDIRAQRGFLILAQNIEEYKRVLDDVAESAGAATEAFEKQEASLAALYDRFKSARQVAAVSFGRVFALVLAPFVERLTGGLQRLSDTLWDFAKKLKDPAQAFAELREKMITFFEGLHPVAKGILAVVGAFLAFKIAGAAWNMLSGIVLLGGRMIISVFRSIFSWPMMIVAGLFVLYTAWKQNWFGIRDLTMSIWEKLKTSWTNFMSGLEKGWQGSYDTYSEIWGNKAMTLSEKIGATLGKIAHDAVASWNAFRDALLGAYQSYQDIANADLTPFQKFVASLGLLLRKIWLGDDAVPGLGTIWVQSLNNLRAIWGNPDLGFWQKTWETIRLIATTALKSVQVIGARITELFGGDPAKYVADTTAAIDRLKAKFEELKQAATWQEKLKISFEIAKDVWTLPAKFIISGFDLPADKEEFISRAINTLSVIGITKFMGGSWRLAVGLGLLADFMFDDNRWKDWQHLLISAAEAVGFSLMLFGPKIGVPISLAIVGFEFGTMIGKNVAEQAYDVLTAIMGAGSDVGKRIREHILQQGTYFQKALLEVYERGGIGQKLAQSIMDAAVDAKENGDIMAAWAALGESMALMFYWGFLKVHDITINYLIKPLENLLNRLFGKGNAATSENLWKHFTPGALTAPLFPGVKKQTGGYTASPNTWQIAGVVHGGEWVAPAWMVRDPRIGLIIAWLEQIRQRGFAAGGYTGTGEARTVLMPWNPAGDVTWSPDWTFKDYLEGLKTELENLIAGIGDLVTRGFSAVFEKLGIDTESLMNKWKEYASAFDDAEEKLKNASNNLDNTLKDAGNELKNAADQTKTAWQEMAQSLADASELFEFDEKTQALKTTGQMTALQKIGEAFWGNQGLGAIFGAVTQGLAGVIPLMLQWALKLDSVQKLLNPFVTIMQKIWDVAAPLLDTLLKPLVKWLEILAQPFIMLLNVLRPAIIWLAKIAEMFNWAMDQILLAVDQVVSFLTFGFVHILSAEQRAEMSKPLEERWSEIEAGAGGGETTESTYGQTFTAGTPQNITNNFNVTFAENVLLTEDEDAMRKLAEAFVQYVKDHGGPEVVFGG